MWDVLEERELVSAEPWLTVSVQRIKLPDGRLVEDYYRIQLPDYVTIVARAPDRRILLLRQYKHGFGAVRLTLPGGIVERGESPTDTAPRELLEETGCTTSAWRKLGSFIPHANYGCGHAHVFLADNVVRTAEPDSGDLEESEPVWLDESGLKAAIGSGDIVSLSSVAALSLCHWMG